MQQQHQQAGHNNDTKIPLPSPKPPQPMKYHPSSHRPQSAIQQHTGKTLSPTGSILTSSTKCNALTTANKEISSSIIAESKTPLPVPKYTVLTLKELITMPRKIKTNRKVALNVTKTKYSVVRHVASEVFHWHLADKPSKEVNKESKESAQTADGSDDEEDVILDFKRVSPDFSIMWCDSYISDDLLRRMLPFQKVNHFPGSHLLGMKNNLCKFLTTLRRQFPSEYDFFPRSWMLPYQYEDLRKYAAEPASGINLAGTGAPSSKTKKYFIVKPEASCQGRGIFITKNPEAELGRMEHYVVQEYITPPYLIDGLKFDMRVYVLVRSVNPLRIFLYREGLARFATEKYEKPNSKNCTNMCMHLTNYAVNKNNPNFVFNESPDADNIGHKRSLSSVLKYLENKGENVSQLIMDIRRMIVKTIATVQPRLSHIYRSSQNKEENHLMCFEILGFDIMIDAKLKPWLLEVNHTPSFSTDTPLDFHIKRSLILDTLNLVKVKYKSKKQYDIQP